MQVEFPSSFLWGAAISSYQCEGGNYNCDWHSWEKEKGLEQAGLACDHYRLFEEDFRLAKELNLNALRFSVEWARICPHVSEFLQQELEHYCRVADSLCKLDIKPIVTLHHFTNPSWFSQSRGWVHSSNVEFFLAYLRRVVESLKDKVDTWIIFNEPLVYIYNGFIQGIWPPGEKSLRAAAKVLDNIKSAYVAGYQEIKRIYRGSGIEPKVSIAKNIRVFSGCPDLGFALNSLSAFARSRSFNFWILDYFYRKSCLHFVALNYYCREYTKFKGLLGRECRHKNHKQRRNYLGWSVYPQGFYDILVKLKKFGLPVIVTENGTAEDQDYFYENFLTGHLRSLAKAFSDGVDIAGYLWWSLLDNFEWDKGFGPRFGLIEVDYSDFKRRVKPFAHTYAEVCRHNRVNI